MNYLLEINYVIKLISGSFTVRSAIELALRKLRARGGDEEAGKLGGAFLGSLRSMLARAELVA